MEKYSIKRSSLTENSTRMDENSLFALKMKRYRADKILKSVLGRNFTEKAPKNPSATDNFLAGKTVGRALRHYSQSDIMLMHLAIGNGNSAKNSKSKQ